MYKTDPPIEKPEDDKFGFDRIAKNLAVVLTSKKEKPEDKHTEPKGEPSFVLAIDAKWGMGKSSFINLLKYRLNEMNSDKTDESVTPKQLEKKELSHDRTKSSSKNTNPYKQNVVVEFDPWNYITEDDNLIPIFYDEIADKLKDGNYKIKKLETAFKDYGKAQIQHKTSSLNIIVSIGVFMLAPLITFLLSLIRSYVSNIHTVQSIYYITVFLLSVFLCVVNYDFWRGNKQKSLSTAKKDISDILVKKNIKLFIMIDDIDRLSQREMLNVFRMIKCNADFPNTVFILAFDKKIVAEVLNNEYLLNNGLNYLQKIVKLWIDLPPQDSQYLLDSMVKEVFEYLTMLGAKDSHLQRDDNMEYWQKYKDKEINTLISNKRDMINISNNVIHIARNCIHEGTVDILVYDLIVLQILKYASPELYKIIRENPHKFTGSDPLFFNDILCTDISLNGETLDKSIDIDLANYKYKDTLRDIMHLLFPYVILDNSENKRYRTGYKDNYVKLRVCALEHFDKYFTYDDEDAGDQIRHHGIMAIINSKTVDEIEAIFVNYTNRLLHIGLLHRLNAEISNHFDTSAVQLKNILIALSNVADSMPPENPNDLFNDILSEILSISKTIFDQIGNSNIMKIFSDVFSKSKGVLFPTYVAYSFIKPMPSERNNEKYLTDDERTELSKKVVDHLNLHRDILIELNSGDIDSFFLFNKWLYICELWKEMDSSNAYSDYIHGLYRVDEMLIEALNKMQSIDHDSSDTVIVRFRCLALAKIHDLPVIYTRLQEIESKNNDLYEDNKEIIERFKTTYKQFVKSKPVKPTEIPEDGTPPNTEE